MLLPTGDHRAFHDRPREIDSCDAAGITGAWVDDHQHCSGIVRASVKLHVRLSSVRGDRRIATPPEFVYGHQLPGRPCALWEGCDELQHDFRPADRGFFATMAGSDFSR